MHLQPVVSPLDIPKSSTHSVKGQRSEPAVIPGIWGNRSTVTKPRPHEPYVNKSVLFLFLLLRVLFIYAEK